MDNRRIIRNKNVTGVVLQDYLILSLENITNSWMVDLVDLFHATPYFQYYVQGDFGQVYLGNDKPCNIIRNGKVHIKLQNGNKWLLKEVKHVLDLRKNLISTRQMGSEGCINTFTNKTWKVTEGALVVAKGEKVGTLYLCNGNANFSIDLISARVDTTLWHHRFGNMSEKGMQILQSRKLLLGLKQVDLKIYQHFVYGKQKRVRFLRIGK